MRYVHHRNGYMPVDEMIAAIDDRTRVLTASSVSFSPGFRTDIDKLGAACRARRVIFLVDAAQSGGVLHTDVKLSNIDALAISTQKGLLALYGMGFLYVRRELAEKMHPPATSRVSASTWDAPTCTNQTSATCTFKFMPAARRFDLGNYNFAAVCAGHESLKLLLSIGTKKSNRTPLSSRTRSPRVCSTSDCRYARQTGSANRRNRDGRPIRFGRRQGEQR